MLPLCFDSIPLLNEIRQLCATLWSGVSSADLDAIPDVVVRPEQLAHETALGAGVIELFPGQVAHGHAAFPLPRSA
jgi:hypothetical protein